MAVNSPIALAGTLKVGWRLELTPFDGSPDSIAVLAFASNGVRLGLMALIAGVGSITAEPTQMPLRQSAAGLSTTSPTRPRS